MRPGVLNPAGERDSRAFGQRGGVKINLEVGQLPADARIEGAVGLGLRERQARRGDRTGEQCGERAAIDDQDLLLPVQSLFSRYLTPGRQAAQATCERSDTVARMERSVIRDQPRESFGRSRITLRSIRATSGGRSKMRHRRIRGCGASLLMQVEQGWRAR